MNAEFYMQRAIQLARQGFGWVNPNPLVGAVIVRDGRIIGEGYHAKYGEAHAERQALAACREAVQGATLYVTLEPCCHQGQTPPCTEAIIASGIREVVIGSRDPNPLVAGQGIAKLEASGITVQTGLLETECRQLNEVFFHYIQTGLPFGILKYAMTADGKMASISGKSQWISSPASRQHVQESRSRYAAIMVGIGTVLADDPLLTCRLPGSKNPVRVICDSQLRLPPESQIAQTAQEVPTIIACAQADSTRQNKLSALGCQIVALPDSEGRVDLQALARYLGRQKLDSLYIEGGGALHYSALQAGIVQRVQVYLAPKLLGGATAPSPVGGSGIDDPNQALPLCNPQITTIGEDLFLEYALRGGR